MALPTDPIDLVALDDIIEVSWGNSVAQSLNNLTEQSDYVTWKPASGVNYDADIGGTGMPTWFTIGGGTPEQIFVPDWATSAYAHFQICGVQYNPTTAGRTTYLLEAQIGSIHGRSVKYSGQPGWFGLSWGSEFAAIDTIAGGDRSVKINAVRTEGTGSERWRLFDQSDVAVWIIFKGAIG
jgi:hypothetical protein